MAGDTVDTGSMIYNGTADVGVTALLGGTTAMPATKFPCRSCHGRDGAGGREGGVPPIRKIDLVRSTPVRPAYDVEALKRALEKGTASDSRPLSGVMPRYALDDAALASLSLYLERLPALQQRGISTHSVSIGVAVPPGNASTARQYATLLQKAIERVRPGGLVHNRRIVIKLLDGTPDAIVAQARDEVLAVVGLLPSLELDVRAFTDQQVPVLFPLFPLDGGEDATIVRGLMADRQDGLRALADRIASDGVHTLAVLDSPECGGAAQDFTKRFARKGVQYKITALPLSSGVASASDIPMLVLCSNRREVGRILGFLSGRAAIYGLANELLSAANLGIGARRMIFATQETSFMFRDGGAENEFVLARHAELAARLLVSALLEARRSINRTSLVNSINSLQVPQTGLDFIRDELNGTSVVGFIETGSGKR